MIQICKHPTHRAGKERSESDDRGSGTTRLFPELQNAYSPSNNKDKYNRSNDQVRDGRF